MLSVFFKKAVQSVHELQPFKFRFRLKVAGQKETILILRLRICAHSTLEETVERNGLSFVKFKSLICFY